MCDLAALLGIAVEPHFSLVYSISANLTAFFIKMEQQNISENHETLGIVAEQIRDRLQQLCPTDA